MTTTRGITGSWLQRWEHWWFRPAPPHAMAVFRIVFSALLFVYWASKLPQIPMAFSREGLVFPSLPDYVPFAFQLLFSPPPLSIAYAVYGCLLLVIVCIGLGWRMRSAAIIALLLSMYEWHVSLYLFNTSFDRVFTFCLAMLACSDADRTYSLAMHLRHGDWRAWEPMRTILPQRLLMLQMSALYIGSGIQ